MTKRNSVSASKKNHKLYRHRTLFYIWIIKRLHPFISPTQSESNIQSAMVAKKSEKWKDSPGEKVWFHAQLASSFPVVHLNISIFTNRNWRFVVLHRRTRVLLFVETSTRRRFRIFIYSLFDVPCGSQQYRPNAFKHFDMSYVSLVNFSTNQNTVLSA